MQGTAQARFLSRLVVIEVDCAANLVLDSTALRLHRGVQSCKLASIEVAIGPPLMRGVSAANEKEGRAVWGV